jgi:hypothetical protein
MLWLNLPYHCFTAGNRPGGKYDSIPGSLAQEFSSLGVGQGDLLEGPNWRLGVLKNEPPGFSARNLFAQDGCVRSYNI